MDLHEFEDTSFDLESLEVEPRLGRRQFLIAGLATGVAVTASAQLRRDRPQAAHTRRQVRHLPARRRLRLPLSEGHDPLDETERDQAHLSAQAPGRQGPALQERRGREDRHGAEGARLHRADPGQRAPARPRVLLPLPHQGQRTRRSAASGRRRRATPTRRCGSPSFPARSYEAGFYNAQAAIAKEPDVDLVLYLGDYIYESHYYHGRPHGHHRLQPRRKRRVPPRVLAEVPPLQERPRPAGDARRPQLRLRLGRPRGRGQLRRRLAELARAAGIHEQRTTPARVLRGAPGERLPGLLQLHAADPLRRATATGSTSTPASAGSST